MCDILPDARNVNLYSQPSIVMNMEVCPTSHLPENPTFPLILNTRGTPPRNAAKIVRTTNHRVSVGVLRIKLHVVFVLGRQVFVETHPGLSFTR